jgi:hypothetical protein
MDAIDQNDLRYLIRYVKPYQNILNPSVVVDLHLAGKTAAPFRKVIPQCCKKFDFDLHRISHLPFVLKVRVTKPV